MKNEKIKKSEKCLCENKILSFVFLAIEEKQLLKIFEIFIGLEIVVPSTVRVLGISAEMFLIFRIDFKLFSYVFNAVPVGFKIIIVVVNFTLFQN